jgi:hypothetical protein
VMEDYHARRSMRRESPRSRGTPSPTRETPARRRASCALLDPDCGRRGDRHYSDARPQDVFVSKETVAADDQAVAA